MIRRLSEIRWILLAAAISYAAVLSRFYVGFWNDDARDILAAHSLTFGRYLNWQLPGHPPADFPLPGFPALLAPFTLFFFHYCALFRVVPFGLTLTCILLLNDVIAPWLSWRARVCALVLFAFNPTTVVAAGRVMADTCFMAIVLASFLALRRTLERPQAHGVFLTGALVGLSAIIRPEGIVLLPALALPLFTSSARRQLPQFLLAGFSPLLMVWLRNYAMARELSGYTPIWRVLLPALSGQYMPLLKNMAVEYTTLCAGLLGGWDFSAMHIPAWVWVYTSVVTLILGKGFLALARDARQETRVMAAFLLYAAGFFLLHSVWLVVDLHYVWHLLPVVLVLGSKGLASSGRRWGQVFGGLLMAGLMGTYTYQYAAGLQETRHRPAFTQFPQETLQWVIHATPADSFFLTPNSALVTLYTQRFAIAFLGVHNEDEFRYRLLQKGITHVLLRPLGFLYVQMPEGQSPAEVWAQISLWMDADPAGFKRIYTNAAEASQIYAVRPNPEFVAAYSLYMQALDAINLGQRTDGIRLLKASFTHVHVASALNAYGIACLLSGENLKDARLALEEALRRRPRFALAALNLARVSMRTHDRTAARHYFAAARAMSQGDASAHFLLPVIDREEKEM